MDIQTNSESSLNNCFIFNDAKQLLGLEEGINTNCYMLDCNLNHYQEILKHLEQNNPVFKEYLFVITRNVDELPFKNKLELEKTVVIIIGDEWTRAPKYADKVALVYKSPGQKLKLAFHKNWLRFNIVVLVQYLRILYKKLSYPNKKNVFSIPLCIYRLPPSPIKPIKDRKYDISFMGSISHNPPDIIRTILKTPKILSRRKVVSVLENLKSKYSIYLKATNGFLHANKTPEEQPYSEIMMDSKICIAPRGTNLETFRYFEGLYYGCIVIAEEQPDYDYLKGSPAIIIKNWDEIPEIIEKLINDKDLLETLHKQAIDYYSKNCAPHVIAEQISKDLSEHYQSKREVKH